MTPFRQARRGFARFAELRWSGAAFGMAVLAVWIGIGCIVTARKGLVDVASVHAAQRLASAVRGAPTVEPASQPPSIGYAIILAAVAVTTPGTFERLSCWSSGKTVCIDGQPPFVIALQALAAFACIWMLWRVAWLLSGRRAIALSAVVLTCLSMRLGTLSGAICGDIWYFLFLCLYLYCLTQTVARGARGLSIAAGAALGCAALFEPLAAVMVPAAALLLLGASEPPTDGSRAPPWLLAIAFLIGAAGVTTLLHWATAPLLSWPDVFARQFAAAAGRRAAFVGLDSGAWLAGLSLPVPWLGEALEAVLPADMVRKFAVGAAPGSLVLYGREVLHADALARAGHESARTLAILLEERVLNRPLDYALSMPIVVARGLFAGGGIVALFGLLHVAGMLRFARAAGRRTLHLVVLLPIAVLFAANAMSTGNEFWLNPLLPFVYAYAAAYVAGGR